MPYDEPYKPADNTSETPATLVAKGGEQYRDELSPNPAHFGFTRQLFFEKLNNVSDSVKDANTLYIVPIKNGDEVVGYYKYRYDLVAHAFVRVVEVEPQNEVKKGASVQSKDAAVVNNPPKAEDPLFNKINRGFREGYIKPLTPNVYKTDNLFTLSNDIIDKLRVGDFVYLFANGYNFWHVVSFANETNVGITYVDNLKIRTYCYVKTGGVWEYTEILESLAYYNTYNIWGLESDFIKILRAGDIVRYTTGGVTFDFVVSYTSNDTVALSYTDNYQVKTIFYTKTGETWAYNRYAIGVLLPEINPATDEGKIIKVVNGAYTLVNP